MTVVQMKKHISDVYDNWRWRDKVRRMSDAQVIAIYHSFLQKGKFKKTKSTRLPGERFHQVTLFECGMEQEEIHG